jgi:ankyrin repeat protein
VSAWEQSQPKASRVLAQCWQVFERSDKVSALQKAIPADFDVNTQFEQMEEATLVNLASRFGRARCVRYLVQDREADVNIADIQGFTVLLNAAWNGHRALVVWLLQQGSTTNFSKLNLDAKGAPPRTSSCGGKGPYDAETWAARKGFTCISTAIRQAKAQRDKTRTNADS